VSLPQPGRAIVDERKLRDYCLNLEHPRGRHKARVFASALGLTADDAEELRQALLSAARTVKAVAVDLDEYGQRYLIDFELRTTVGRATVRSGWIVRSNENFARFTTCWILPGAT
jgi:hypothetical protein